MYNKSKMVIIMILFLQELLDFIIMSKNINVGGANITIPAFPKKPTKMGIVNYIKNFFKENKKLERQRNELLNAFKK